MLLKIFNRALIEDRRKTYLTAAVTASGTTLTVANVDTNGWADNDYMILGEIGSPTAEIMQVNGAISDGTSMTIDRGGSGGTRFAHSIGEPIYRIDYNQVEFSRSATDSTSGVSVLSTAEVTPEMEFSSYEDTTNSTGYGFARFKNATTSAFSSYSDGVNYDSASASSSYDPRTLWRLRKRIRVLLDEDRPNSKLGDDQIRDAVNDKQRDIAHLRLWAFFEVERSFSAVANQFAYDIPSTVQKLYNSTHKTQPLLPMNYDKWKLWHWNDNSSTTICTGMCVWNRQLLVYPRPSSAAVSTTLGAAITTTTATSITVVATSAFRRGDYYRFIIDSEVIYAPASTSTTFTGCLRGQENTTAATHSNGATVTERDLVYTAHVEPTDLMDTQDRTPIPEADVVAYGAAIDLAPFCGKQELIPTFEAKYSKLVKSLEGKYAVKVSGRFGRIKDSSQILSDSMASRDPNLYPSSITGTN